MIQLIFMAMIHVITILLNLKKFLEVCWYIDIDSKIAITLGFIFILVVI